MPVKSKRSPPKKKPTHKAKAAPKAHKKPVLKAVKSVSKPKPKPEAKAAASKQVPQGKSILWKILAERQRRQAQAPSKPTLTNHRGTQHPQSTKHEKFARFAGPRRRVA